jgi:hypothetical protein
MKVRSQGELSSVLDDEEAWRKRELINLGLEIKEARKHYVPHLVRAGVCLLYAHWEGFVKTAGQAYLAYVAHQGLKFADLPANLAGVGLRSHFRLHAVPHDPIHLTEVVSFLIGDRQEKATLDWEKAINTRDNLNSAVLQEILCTLGLDYAPYETKRVFLDRQLLHYRNQIAHGARIEDELDYPGWQRQVIDLIGLFRTDVENAAARALYRKT